MVCHLDAKMVRSPLDGWQLLDHLDFLLIENVGNLVCLATSDLGEDLRLILFTVTEGEDKPLKYPTIVNTANTANIAAITKIDLARAIEFDHAGVQSVRPGVRFPELSAKTGEGMDRLMALLESHPSSSGESRRPPWRSASSRERRRPYREQLDAKCKCQ